MPTRLSKCSQLSGLGLALNLPFAFTGENNYNAVFAGPQKAYRVHYR